jgi:NAD(P)H dehydrogenase (quinone)
MSDLPGRETPASEDQMTRILVLYYSSYGHVRILADAVAEGARTVAGATVDIRRIPETVPEEVRKTAGFVDDDTPAAAPADLADYDGILFGTPTRFGLMAGQMKQFLDQAGGLWMRNALVGKVAGVFVSTGSQHGGHEATMLSTQIALQHFGLLIAGLPYSFAGQTSGDGIIGGAPYGAGTIAGADGGSSPNQTEIEGARFLGAHVADIAARLTAGSATRLAA